MPSRCCSLPTPFRRRSSTRPFPMAWVPTVELTVHVRGVPAPGPLRVAFRSRFIHDGLLDEEGELWDSAGALVAQSRQLSLMPRPA